MKYLALSVVATAVAMLAGCQQNYSPATKQRDAMRGTVTSTNAQYENWQRTVESYGAYDDSVITDTDWNARFKRSGTMKKSAIVSNTELNDSFYRVTLEPGDIGSAWTDVQNGKERAEVSGQKLDKQKKYRYSFSARIVEGMTGYESFFQIHQANTRQCDVGPIVMIHFRSGQLSMAKRGSVPHVSKMYGKWQSFSFEIDFTTGETTNWRVNGKTVGVDYLTQVAECGVPYVKFGIYRGRASHRSVVDFDDVLVEQLN